MIRDNVLTILSPKQQVKQFQLHLIPKKGIAPEYQIHYEEKPLKIQRADLANETISFYQTASAILKRKEYQKL